jgi:hypothetical protein
MFGVFLDFWSILRLFTAIWYIISGHLVCWVRFGILYQENLAALICGENYRRDVELSTSKLPTVKMVT